MSIAVLNDYLPGGKHAGDFSRNVWYLQRFLIAVGHKEIGDADGWGGDKTKKGYDAWRKANGFQDGLAGLGSVTALAKAAGSTKTIKEK